MSKEKRKLYDKTYRESHRDERRSYNKNYNESHKTEKQDYTRLYRYNLTPREYSDMLEKQDNKCVICHVDFTNTPCIDHNHTTGKVRGLLCVTCNTRVGYLESELIEETRQYIMRDNYDL